MGRTLRISGAGCTETCTSGSNREVRDIIVPIDSTKLSGWKLHPSKRRITFSDKKGIGELKLLGKWDIHTYPVELIKRVRIVRRADGYYIQCNISGFGKLGHVFLNRAFSIGLIPDNNLVGDTQPSSSPLEGFWKISLDSKDFNKFIHSGQSDKRSNRTIDLQTSKE